MRRKNITEYNERKATKHPFSVVYFCFCCFTVIFLTSCTVFAEPQKNDPDPTDILESLINTNKNITAAPKPVAIKIEANSTSPVSFAAKDRTASNELTSSRITTAVSEKNSKSKSDLKALIDQLNSIKVKNSSSIYLGTKNNPTNMPSDETIDIEDTKIKSSTDTSNKTSQKQSYEWFTIDIDNNNNFTENNFDATRQQGGMKSETIKLIKDLINNPKSFNSFFELGEIMFNSNRLSDAYEFYKIALDSADKNDEENRSWILFQTANCLRNTDYSKAIEFYKRLITEFPHCQWSEFAKDQIELLSWYLNDNPQGLIAKSKILVE